MSLEGLPAELFLSIFRNLSTDDLIHAFHGLNQHFRDLLVTHFKVFGADLEFIREPTFRDLRGYYPPYIRSLRLSPHIDYPTLSNEVISRNLHLNEFSSLQSLLINRMRSFVLMDSVISQMSHLSNLTRLHISSFGQIYDTKSVSPLLNHIWSLPQLDYFHLDAESSSETYFPNIERSSASLRQIELPNLICPAEKLAQLLRHSPGAEHLVMNCVGLVNDQQISDVFKQVKILHIDYSAIWATLSNILRSMPNLEDLTVIANISIKHDGYRWQKLISNHLVNLRVFCFIIEYRTPERYVPETGVPALLDSFRTNFWLGQDHHWCVRCDWEESNTGDHIHLYTLPYLSNKFYECCANTVLQSAITCDQHYPYDNVQALDYGLFPMNSFRTLPIGFNHLNHLSTRFPVDNNFRAVVTNLDQLEHLEFTIDQPNINNDFVNLINEASNLQRLTLKKWPLASILPLLHGITITSIRRLELSFVGSDNLPQYFETDQCEIFYRTSLCAHCEILSIAVRSRDIIPNLISNTLNLRFLVVKCADDPGQTLGCDGPVLEDQTVTWLQPQLSPTYVVFRKGCSFSPISIWIR